MIWKNKPEPAILNEISQNTAVSYLAIEFTEIGDDYLVATMPVDHRHIQPAGILHGGVSAVLAETLGSVASSLCVSDLSKRVPVGIEINANHLKSVSGGYVTGIATPVRIGQNLHVWNIEIKDEKKQLVCVSRLTTMIIDRK